MNLTIQFYRVACIVSFACICVAGHATERTNLLHYTTTDGKSVPITNAADWRKRRASILESMQVVMGALPGERKRVSLDVRIDEEVECSTYVRRKITYLAEPNARVPAYLLIPKEALSGSKKSRRP